MADITLQLIWYRLGETYTNLAERYDRFLDWYQDFSWRRVDLLDMLFLGWLVAAFVVVGAINIYLKFFGHPKLRQGTGHGAAFQSANGSVSGSVGSGSSESCHWINSLLSWIYLHYNHTPEFVDGWLKALNDQARKHSSEMTVKFDRLQPGSLPPKFTNIRTEASNSNSNQTFTIYANVETTDLSFLVSLLHQSSQSMKVANCDVIMQKLVGQLQIQLKMVSVFSAEQIDITASFTQRPDMNLLIKPKAEAKINSAQLEKIVKEALSEAAIMLSMSPWGTLSAFPAAANRVNAMESLQSQTSNEEVSSNGDVVKEDKNLLDLCQKVENYLFTNQPQSNVHLPSAPVIDLDDDFFDLPDPPVNPEQASTLNTALPGQKGAPRGESPRPKSLSEIVKIPASSGRPVSLKDKQLLVKVIKANGLSDKSNHGKGDPYCRLQLDEPAQTHQTSVVRASSNPFWDEHFVFDLTENTKHIKLDVFDKEKPQGEDNLGGAHIPMSELRRMPSSRQIIPLLGRKAGGNATLTVEFLFLEPGEGGSQTDGMSPRRRIETTRGVLPGGVNYTSTTTTTERPRDVRLDTSYNETPNRIQKYDSPSTFAENAPYSNRSSSALGYPDTSSQVSQELMYLNGETQAVASTALRELTSSPGSRQPRTPPRTSTLIITGVSQRVQSHDENDLEIDAVDDSHVEEFFTPHKDITVSPRVTMHTPSELALEQGRDPRYATLDGKGQGDESKKSRSFASALKKKFQRPRKAQRSLSADRASMMRHHDASLLRPPGANTLKTTDDLDASTVPEDDLQKTSRSHSFSNSLKKLFRGKKKKSADGQYPSSRESSVSRASRQYDDLMQPSPQLSTGRYEMGGAPLDASSGRYDTLPAHYRQRQTGGTAGQQYLDPGSTSPDPSLLSSSVPASATPIYNQ